MDSILVIDDDLALCRLLQRTLCAEGYDARFSLTGAKGLQTLRQVDFRSKTGTTPRCTAGNRRPARN